MHFSQIGYLLGLSAGVIFILTVVVGGKLWPGYTIYQAISELTLPTSPNRTVITALFVLFNLLLLLYGIVTIVDLSANPWLNFSGWMYIVAGLAGFVMAYYPMDHRHNRPTMSGYIHRRMATLAIICSVIIVACSAVGFSQVELLRPLARLSIVLSVPVTLTAWGIWISALRKSLAFGTFQKASLGLFTTWLCWSSVMLHFLLS